MWPIAVPEAARCECCCAFGCYLIVWRWVVANFRPHFLPRTSIYASGRVVFALPECARCGPNFCRRLVDVTSCFCRRLPEVAKKIAGGKDQDCTAHALKAPFSARGRCSARGRSNGGRFRHTSTVQRHASKGNSRKCTGHKPSPKVRANTPLLRPLGALGTKTPPLALQLQPSREPLSIDGAAPFDAVRRLQRGRRRPCRRRRTW